ncbi:MAG: inositol monophosphatase [Rhodobacteraceae bacterium]|nr:inositol monophosphatase [Paracoccaceae bacterium]
MNTLDHEILSMMRFASERALMPRWRNLAKSEIVEKEPGDLVTVADREIEQFLTDALRTLAEDVAVVGEEAVHADPEVAKALSGPCWIIDPLDGTHNFASGEGPFGIMIALADAGETLAGWIYDPREDRLCHARKGEGAFINGERVSARETGEEPPIAAISQIFLDDAEREATKAKLADHYRMVDIPRCAAEQYPRLALGTNDVSVFKRTLAWDHAAGTLWLNEAGGKCARPDGSPYRVDEHDKPGLIGASSPRLWDELAARLAGF